MIDLSWMMVFFLERIHAHGLCALLRCILNIQSQQHPIVFHNCRICSLLFTCSFHPAKLQRSNTLTRLLAQVTCSSVCKKSCNVVYYAPSL
ncbi:hypothetical protein F5B22DRAFT_509556 [Xylaria bambusicola]|uniref:uncharacterized protein n=1 Tax=Xylaria bambusicola TaxID=326684 RepID=UPI002007B6B2|nr:uncharacterized protein F5B22DRAFT_509556 [Xylaria bambusicola]KAI0521903.1 hypothetical protein F5B22DRAFT_509556 [Xylaria bambusicola]